MRRQYWLLLSLAGLVLLFPMGWATFLLELFIPGFALASLVRERFTAVELLALPVTLSIAILPVAALAASPFPFHATTVLLSGIIAVIGIYHYHKDRLLSFDPKGIAPLAIAAIIFLIVFIVSLKTFHIGDDGGLYYTFTQGLDQTFHLSIAQRYIVQPQVPPQDPYMAGYSMAYNWGMNVLFGEICLASGLSLLIVFKVVVAAASALIFLDTYLLAAALFKDDLKAAVGAALLYIGTSGLSWLYVLNQHQSGTGTDVFNDLVYQWPGITVLKYDPTSLYFFLPQPQTFGLLVMILCFFLVITGLRTKSVAAMVLAGLSMASLVFFQIINAFPVLIAIFLICLYTAYKDHSRRMLLALSIPLALGGLGILIEYLMFPANAGSQLSLGHHPDVAITLIASLGPLLPFAAYGIYRTWRDPGAQLLALFAFLNLLLLNILILGMTNDTYRFLTYLSLPVALFAGYILTSWATSRNILKIATAAAIILLMVPSTLMIFNFYNDAPEISLSSHMDVSAIQWIENNTPTNTVIFESPDDFPRVPILSGRNILFAGEPYMMQYHGIDLYPQTNDIMSITDPGNLSETLSYYGVDYVLDGGKEMGQPFSSALADPEYFKKVYDQNGFIVYQVLNVSGKQI